MGRHKEWRKIAKKIRRKKIRSALAQLREAQEREEEEKRKMSPNYEKRIAEEEAKMIAAKEAEMKELEEKLRKWEEEEQRVREETVLRMTLLKELEERNEKERIEKLETEKKIAEEEEEKMKRIRDCLNNFAGGTIDVLPDDMLVPTETQPGKEMCPFFYKVAACRFRDTCSRNHVRPAVSKVLLFPGFYLHCSMSHIGLAEYDTDISLEYDENEMYSHFLEFYQDIRSEFEKYGNLTRLLVCTNHESHLRGNVYASYTTEREAMTAFLKFNGRYYAGRMITCHFVNIPNWKSAICGLYFKQKCPKGDACNFLHVFKDPGPPFHEPIHDRNSPDDWRWSLSPEEGRSHYHETNSGSERSSRRSQSRSSVHQRSDRRADSNHHHRTEVKEDTGSSRARHRNGRRHSNERNRRNRSRDRKSHSDKRSRDKTRHLKSAEGKNRNRRTRSRSRRRRDSSRDRSSTNRNRHRKSVDKSRAESNGRKRHRSSSSSGTGSSSSDDETTSSSERNHSGNEGVD